jgi:hypothetical protein
VGTQLGCKLQLQAFAALYSWVGTQLGCKTAAASFCSALQLGGHAARCNTLFYSWWERSSAVKLQLQAFAALYSWVGTQLGRKTAAASVCSALRLVGELCGKTAAFYSRRESVQPLSAKGGWRGITGGDQRGGGGLERGGQICEASTSSSCGHGGRRDHRAPRQRPPTIVAGAGRQ